ncbi:hypothetical protein BN140_1010 [Methanoculleus bourgensis MS2]|uniref:Uncharacterized protein n=1 Tax=Methanoculleus bourgensis (strain ATCC 43281 / DSM 3045 / OCM 15 / MS2) TaxID=1201294 RepID=I7J873_METBM|nr:hypothetical protein BN140_1010 [Methanoculleus bourgensis MS2]
MAGVIGPGSLRPVCSPLPCLVEREGFFFLGLFHIPCKSASFEEFLNPLEGLYVKRTTPIVLPSLMMYCRLISMPITPDGILGEWG